MPQTLFQKTTRTRGLNGLQSVVISPKLPGPNSSSGRGSLRANVSPCGRGCREAAGEVTPPRSNFNSSAAPMPRTRSGLIARAGSGASAASQTRPFATARRRTGGPGGPRARCGAGFASFGSRGSREPARPGNAFRGRHRRRRAGSRWSARTGATSMRCGQAAAGRSGRRSARPSCG
jgi:hypothetical protein